MSEVVRGGCHCGAVRFEVVWPEDIDPIHCNCSICSKKGYLHLIVPESNFNLLQGAHDLVEYRFNTGVAIHKFCRICGIHSFYTPRSHPDCVDVNVNALDEGHGREFRIIEFDGTNWEENVDEIR